MDTESLLLLTVALLLAAALNKARSLNRSGRNQIGAGRKSVAQGHDQIKKGRKAISLSLPWGLAAGMLAYVLLKLVLSGIPPAS